jgi:lysophospholipase L1-like esterase
MRLRERASKAAGRHHPVRRLVRGALAATLSLALAFALAEAGARLAGFEPESDRAAGFRWHERGQLYFSIPGHSRSVKRRKPLRVNEMGLRGPHLLAKRPRSIRILLLGDSVAFGYDVAEEEIFATLVAQKLGKRGEVEVVNGSVPGWSRRQQRIFLDEYGPELQPDLVVFTIVLNDLRELRTSAQHLRWSVYFVGALDWATQRSALATALKSALATAARPANEFHTILDLYRRMDESTDDPEVREALDLELAETERLLHIARERGHAVAAILVPMSFQLASERDPAVQRELRENLVQRGVPVLDLLPVLRPYDADAVFLDHVHLSERGHRLTARALVALIDAHRLLAPARPRSG